MADLHLASPDDARQQYDADLEQRVTDAEQQRRIARRELHALERSLAAILSSPSVSAAQRAEFVGLLSSTRRRRIDPDLAGVVALSSAEDTLVQVHRGLSRGAKAVLSGVATALAERDQLRQAVERLRRKGKRRT